MIFFSNLKQPPKPRNIQPHLFGLYPVCPFRAEKTIFYIRVFYLNVITNFDRINTTNQRAQHYVGFCAVFIT